MDIESWLEAGSSFFVFCSLANELVANYSVSPELKDNGNAP
jgi:hypothetical protein